VSHHPHASNHLLASLPAAELELLLPHLKAVELVHEAVLFDVGETIEQVYFPHSGVVSLVVSLASGELIETAMVGRDSLVGGSSALDGKVSLNKAIVQIAGHASVLGIERLRSAANTSIPFRTSLIRHEQLILVQAQQSAACNITHALEARLSRWLLRCRDLTGSEDLDLTQEFVSQMLGVRRTSVSIVAGSLQQAGLIRYRRGHIRILDVDGLREAACECYETIRAQSERLVGGGASPTPELTVT
jgi:CRP-like cAMP-binding protein